MQNMANFIDRLNETVGQFVNWFNFLLVLLICLDVLMRYAFNFSLIWIIELETYFFAIIFLLGSAYALKYDKHVRVDVFYQKQSKTRQAWINLLGTILFLIPWCGIAIYVCFKYAWMSFSINESSSQPGGLPALYVLKFIMAFGFVLLFLQGLSLFIKSLLTVLHPPENSH